MLLHQAIPCFKLWFGFSPSVDTKLIKILDKKIKMTLLVAITGGIGSGKSTFSNQVIKRNLNYKTLMLKWLNYTKNLIKNFINHLVKNWIRQLNSK